jgi:hypothetical protein
MRTLTKVAFICNLCFFGCVGMRYLEMTSHLPKNTMSIIGFHPLQSTIIILGYSAVLVNLFFFAVFSLRKLVGKDDPNPIILFYSNMGSLFFQLYYFLA